LLLCDEALRVIWAYSRYLEDDDFQMPTDIEISEQFIALDHHGKWITQWDLEILAKEIILNAGDFRLFYRSLRIWNGLANTVNSMKKFDENISGVRRENILIELNRIAHRQFTWQENSAVPMLVRHYDIFNTAAINEMCLAHLGLSVDQIYLCGIAFVSIYLQEFFLKIPFPSEIPALTENVVRNFLSFTCRTMPELRNILQTEQKYYKSFFYAYNSLRAYPLIRMKNEGKDSIVCPLPTLLIWRFTAGLYYELYGDKGFANAFGRSFQEYIGRAIARACPGERLHLLAEQRYGTKKARKASVDWIVSDEEAAIFLECKAKRPSWGTKVALDDLGALEADFDHMANAIIQLYKTIGEYQRGQYGQFSFEVGRKIYPVVVTLENWHIFLETAQKIHELVVQKLSAIRVSPHVLEEMPYSIWYVGDLEAGMQVINEIGIRRFMDGKICDPEMRHWEWRSYMTQMFKGKFSRKKFFLEGYDAIFAKIIGRSNC